MSASSRGRIVLGGYPGSNCDFYMSDRPFIAALSGRALLDHRLGGVDTLFDDGREWALAAGVDETIKRIDQLLANGPESTRSMGMAGESAVRSRHMTTHRTDVMVRVLEECRAADLSGVLPRPPQFGYFHSGVDEKSIYPLVLRGGWSL
jgi:hypothetical protein